MRGVEGWVSGSSTGCNFIEATDVDISKTLGSEGNYGSCYKSIEGLTPVAARFPASTRSLLTLTLISRGRSRFETFPFCLFELVSLPDVRRSKNGTRMPMLSATCLWSQQSSSLA